MWNKEPVIYLKLRQGAGLKLFLCASTPWKHEVKVYLYPFLTSALRWREWRTSNFEGWQATKSPNHDSRWPCRESSPVLPECKYAALPLYQSALPISIRTNESLTRFVFSLSCNAPSIRKVPFHVSCLISRPPVSPAEKYLAFSHHMWPWQRAFFFTLVCIKDLTLFLWYSRQGK